MSVFRCFLLSFAVYFLTACSGESGAPPATNNSLIKSGVLQSRAGVPVSGVRFVAGDEQGVTDDQGRFRYMEGQQVQFFVGAVAIGSRAFGADQLGIEDLAMLDQRKDQQTANTLRWFIESLDDDQDVSNGIVVSNDVIKLAEHWPAIDFSANGLSTEFAGIISDIASILPGVSLPPEVLDLCGLMYHQPLEDEFSPADMRLVAGSDGLDALSLPALSRIPGKFTIGPTGNVVLDTADYPQQINWQTSTSAEIDAVNLSVPLLTEDWTASCINNRLSIQGQRAGFTHFIERDLSNAPSLKTVIAFKFAPANVVLEYSLSLNESNGLVQASSRATVDLCEQAKGRVLNNPVPSDMAAEQVRLFDVAAGALAEGVRLPSLRNIPGNFIVNQDNTIDVIDTEYQQSYVIFEGERSVSLNIQEQGLQAQCADNQLIISGQLAEVTSPIALPVTLNIPVNIDFQARSVHAAYMLKQDSVSNDIIIEALSGRVQRNDTAAVAE